MTYSIFPSPRGPTGPQGPVGPAGSAVVPVTKVANYNAVAGDLVLADTTGGAFTVTLPPAAPEAGKTIMVKKITSGFALYIASSDGMVFDSIQTSVIVLDPGTSFTFISDGTYWNVT